MSRLEGSALVTGSAGLVGSHLLERLLQEGCRVRAVVHRKESRVRDPRVQWIQGDLRDLSFCRKAVEGIHWVFHCAANTSGAQTMAATPMVHVTPNIVMNAHLFEACYEAGVRKVLWLSSTTGYPDTGSRPVTEEEMFNGEPYAKYFFVGWMKRYTEILARTYSEKLPRKMPVLVLRPTNIYGEWDDFEPATSHVLPALIRKVCERQDPLEVWGDGTDVRDVIHVQDMVEAMLRAMERLDTFCPLNIGLGKTLSVRDALKMMLEIEGYQPKVVYNASKPTMTPVRLLDVGKAERLLGFRAQIGLREGVERPMRWYKENRLAAVR